jgi:D-lactate dehydrogenase (cytochrome)
MIWNRNVGLAIERLQSMLGDRASVNATVREQHGRDESWFEVSPPDAVCFAETVEEVASILRICNDLNVPVIPFGAGTGVAGLVNAIKGGVSVDLSRMDKIIAVRHDDSDCSVQAGVTRNQLNKYLRDTGLFFSVDPGADCTLGGMAATRASGTNTVRYGTMRENVLAMKVALPNGEVINTGSRARKSASSYDLTHLFIGSEGTLGIIVELTLRLHGVPAASSTAVVQFSDIDSAVRAVVMALQFEVPVARIELADETLVNAMNAYSGLGLKVANCLFVEFHGTDRGVEEAAETFREICNEESAAAFHWTNNADESAKLWQARHNAAWAFLAMRPNTRNFSTDVCVPISALAACIRDTRADIDENLSMTAAIAGHIGDGNFHVAILVNPAISEEKREVEEFYDRLVSRALAAGGTCTGEHGIGIQKLKYVKDEFTLPAVNLMRAIKTAIDPKGIMNPGKKIPPPEGCLR